MRKRMLLIPLALLLAVSLVATGCPAPAPPEVAPEAEKVWTMVYATAQAATSSMTIGDMYYLDRLEEESDGRIVFDRYVGGVLGGFPEALGTLREATVDVTYVVPGYFPAELPFAQLMGLGYTTKDTFAHIRACNDLADESDALRKEFEANNFKMLLASSGGNVCMWSSVPIPNVDAAKGLKIRSHTYNVIAYKTWGITTISLPFGECYVAAERGTVDGLCTPVGVGYHAGSFHEVLPYCVETGMGMFSQGGVCVRLDRWNELPKELQDLFVRLGGECVYESRIKIPDEEDKRAVDLMIANDTGHLNYWTEEEQERAKAMVQPPMREQWIKATVDLGYDEATVRDLVDTYIELLRKYEAESTYQNPFDYWAEKIGLER